MKNRGMLLEQIINKTIRKYKRDDIAIFHKKDIPFKFGSISKDGKNLRANNVFVMSKSTTDYYGLYNGTFVAFEAKSTKEKLVPKTNFKIHQHNYLKDIARHGGIGFYIIFFSSYEEFYLIDYKYVDINESLKMNVVISKGYKLELIYPGYLNIVEILKIAK